MQEFEKQICPYKLRPSPRSRHFLGLVTKASSPTTLPLKVSWQEAENAVNAFKGGVLSQGSQAQQPQSGWGFSTLGQPIAQLWPSRVTSRLEATYPAQLGAAGVDVDLARTPLPGVHPRPEQTAGRTERKSTQ